MPQNLQALKEGPKYGELKKKFIEQRAAFQQNPKSAADLTAYERGDNNYEYTVIKGLLPPPLVGKSPPDFPGVVYQKSDTFLTDYAERHPKEYVLSATTNSYIIGNIASHDTRQYMPKYDPDFKDKTPTAGMSYLHFLVIPKRRVYNAVALNDVKIIEEMTLHFKNFWASNGSAQKSIDRINLALRIRAEDVLKGYKAKPETEAQRTEEFNSIMIDIRAAADGFAQKLLRGDVKQDDFFFGFHAAPDAGIAHLHMHVLLAPSEFRKYSTDKHDWKTIPVEAVIEVIEHGSS